TSQLEALYTIIRPTAAIFSSTLTALCITHLLIEESLSHLPVSPKTVETPTRALYDGVEFEGKICGCRTEPIHENCRSTRAGKILVQREETVEPQLFYSKEHGVPEERIPSISLVRPPSPSSLATLCSVFSIHISFDLLSRTQISSPESLNTFYTTLKSRIVNHPIGEGINKKAYIIPEHSNFSKRRY
ncbi:hypothetical protein BC629DRAFT_1252890, partial [Irpex lacteus]